MSEDNDRQDRDGKGASGISRREVLLTVGGVAAAVVRAGAAIWGVLELFVTKQHTVVGRGLNVTYLQVAYGVGDCGLGAVRAWSCLSGLPLCASTTSELRGWT